MFLTWRNSLHTDLSKALVLTEIGPRRDPTTLKLFLSNMERLLRAGAHGYALPSRAWDPWVHAPPPRDPQDAQAPRTARRLLPGAGAVTLEPARSPARSSCSLWGWGGRGPVGAHLSPVCAQSSASFVMTVTPPQPSLPRVCAVTVATPDGLNLRSLKVHRVKVVSFSCTSHTSGATALGWWLRGAEWSITTESSIGRHGSGPRAQNRAFGKRPWALV